MKKIFLAILLSSSLAQAAGWSFNVGSKNPPGASLGLNFMYLWTNWAFEAGIGSIRNTANDQTVVGGDINFKYLFRSGTFRPYLQAGTGASVGNGVSAGGSAFGGAGIFLMGSSLYGYLGYVTGGNGGDVQFGIGFNL